MTDRKEFRDLAPPETAHEAIESLNLGGGTEHVPLSDARGRVLAGRIDADLDVPGFDRAKVDGYAVRARDTFGADEVDPVVLDIAGAVHAGERPDVTVEDGTAAEISTGAVVPPGADAVVMVERTTAETDDDGTETSVAVETGLAPGDGIMFAGSDVAAGERALGPGTELTPREIGLLSALGVEEVPVRATPKVGIISTGDELVRPGDDLDSRAGQIFDVNSYTTATAVEEAGGKAVLYPHAGDDYDEMERILTEAADECDLVLSSGSTSASAVDVIYRVIEERGDLLLHGVAVKPGKPMLVGRLGQSDGGESAYVGLPGYPVSALTIFQTFVAPAIREAAGLPEPRTATVEGRMAVQDRFGEGRLRLMPVGLLSDSGDDGDGDDRPLVYPVDKGSGATTSLTEADGIVAVHPDTEYVDAGETVEVRLFSPSVRPPTLLGVGEDDPAWSRLLDRLERPRYLSVGTREGTRRLRDGVPDIAVAAGPVERDIDAVDLGGWTREWGLVVPQGNPDGIEGVASLVESDLRLVNRTTNSGLRRSLDAAVAEVADERGVSARDLQSDIDGYDLTVRAYESPPRKVAAGDADAGLGLRHSADRLGLGFVPLGEQDVRVLTNPERVEKASVEQLRSVLDESGDVLASLSGFE